MFALALFLACQPMESSGDIFSPVKVEKAQVAASTGKDDRFEFADEEAFVITSEEMAKNAPGAPGAGGAVSTSAELSDAAPVAAPQAVGVPSPAQFPVRLVSTVALAQPPRAILGLPSGEEVVVAPGSVLAAQGLVVMMITEGRVQLARIEPSGDHAKIESFDIVAQY